MTRRTRRAIAMDSLTALVAVAAVALLVRERLIPWLEDRAIVDPGDSVGSELALIDALSGDSIRVSPDSPAVLLVFRSTCAACDRATPVWSRVAGWAGTAVIAIGLEPAASAGRYAKSRLPGARPAVPADPRRFARLFRIHAVPTTLVIDRGGRLASRRTGPLEESDVAELRRRLDSSDR